MWSNRLNWSGDVLPGAGDDVTIAPAGSLTIIHDEGSDQIASLSLQQSLTVTGGSLTISGQLTTRAGQTISAAGGGVVFTANGLANIDGMNLKVSDGATLALPAASSYANTRGYETATTLEAVGTGSTLDLRNVVSLTQAATNRVALIVRAAGGGKVDLGGLAQIVDPESGDLRGRSVQITADGVAAAVDLSSLVQLQDASNSPFWEWTGFSSITPQNGGAVLAPKLGNVSATVLTWPGFRASPWVHSVSGNGRLGLSSRLRAVSDPRLGPRAERIWIMRPDSTNETDGDDVIPMPTPLHGGLPVIDPNDDFLDDDDDHDEFDPDDEMDGLEGDDEPRTVLITGALGNVGRKLRSAWADDYDLILLDADPGDDEEVFKADLSVFDEDWITHFHGVDTVVHLAANPDPDATVEDLTGPNIDALANVFNAAALAGVERVVFASSNHVMGAYRDEEPELIGVGLPPKPSGAYGILKLVGERLGRSLAHAFDVTFIALRLGYVQPGANRSETLTDDWSRKMWLSNGDLVRLFDAAVEAEIEDRLFLVVNGVSRNHGTPWDLSDAAEILGYLPEDDAFAARDLPEPVDEPV